MKKKSTKTSLFHYFKEVDSSADRLLHESTDDITDSLGFYAFSKKTESRFLNRFSDADIMRIMKKVDLLDHLSAKGFDRIMVRIERDEALVNYLKIYDSDISPDRLLIDLRLTESKFIPERGTFDSKNDFSALDMIVIEWLSIQNPSTEFPSDKPQLPGQRRPGLGALKFMMEMMYLVAKEVIRDGFLDIPDHMHGAIMYSSKFKFFNPIHEAILRAILRDLSAYSLSEVSWGMITNTVIDRQTGGPQAYKPTEQIFAVSRRLRNYFSSRDYTRRFKEEYKKRRYHMDYERMCELRSNILKDKSVVDL